MNWLALARAGLWAIVASYLFAALVFLYMGQYRKAGYWACAACLNALVID
jgi:hypothetical protein